MGNQLKHVFELSLSICFSKPIIMNNLVDCKTILDCSLDYASPAAFDVCTSLWFPYQPWTFDPPLLLMGGRLDAYLSCAFLFVSLVVCVHTSALYSETRVTYICPHVLYI